MGTTPDQIPEEQPTIKSDLPPELSKGTPTEEQKFAVLREAVNFYLRQGHRAPDVRKICEEFIAAIDDAARGSVETPPPDVETPPDGSAQGGV